MYNFLIFFKKVFFKIIFLFFYITRKICFKIGTRLLFISESIIPRKIYPYLKKNSYPVDKFFIKIFLKHNFKKINKKFLKIKEKNKGKDYSQINKNSSWSDFKFKPVLITVEQKSKRAVNTINKLKELNIKPHIFRGKTPSNLRDFLFENNTIMSPSRPVDISCFVSHLLAIKDSLNKFKNKYFLIMEDDVILFPDPKLIGLTNVIKNDDWDILQLEHCLPEAVFRNKNFYESGILLQRWMNPFDYGMGAYIIKRSFAKFLIKYFFDSASGKINLNKCYQYHYPIVSDNIIFDLAQTLVFTFPLAHQNLNFSSLLGYSSDTMSSRFSAVVLVKEIWERYK